MLKDFILTRLTFSAGQQYLCEDLKTNILDDFYDCDWFVRHFPDDILKEQALKSYGFIDELC